MQSFVRGWNFLKQAWQMALADQDLIKPSIYNLFAGFIVSILGIFPFVAAFFLFGGGNGPFGQVAFGVIGAVMVFIHYAVSYIFSAMTIYLIYGYLSEGDGVMNKAWAIVRSEFLNILSLAVASTVVNVLRNAVKGKGNRSGRNFLAGLIDTIWTEATFLVLPAMVIEDINLRGGLKRATQITKDNLLLVGISTVGVKAVTGLIGFLLGLIGAGLGFVIGFGLINLFGSGVTSMIIGVGLGVLVFMLFIMVATVIDSYTATAYHTCLYLWARDVERARQGGPQTIPVSAPAPLAAVLE
jgi:hypothetical protein